MLTQHKIRLVWGSRNGRILCAYKAELLSKSESEDIVYAILSEPEWCRTPDSMPTRYTKLSDIPDGLRKEVELLIGKTMPFPKAAIEYDYTEPPC